MLSDEQLRTFGRDGVLVLPGLVPEAMLVELDAEVDGLIAEQPPPPDKVGFHHHFPAVARLPVADRVLRDSGLLGCAAELVAPHPLDHAFDHIQVATSISGWDHRPGGGHIDGYSIPGQTEPQTFTMLAAIFLGDETEPDRGNLWIWPGSHRGHERLFRERGVDILLDDASQGGHACLLDPAPDLGTGEPLLVDRGDAVLAHHLVAHNQSGNLADVLRRTVYYRLAAAGHRARWRATQTDSLLEYAPVRAALER